MTDITQTFMNANLGRYEVRERLGTGGMARVFKGYDTNLDRIVAIKVLHEHLADEPTFKERFEREAKFVGSLNHPNIVQVYDYNVLERSEQMIFYMVMSYLPGPTLREIMNQANELGNPLSDERVLQIMTQLTDALGYAHDRGMIHRDVKPANILMNERGEVVLTDFGIARLTEGSNLTQEGLTVGTPAYMSPEQTTGDMVDARTDLYALGIILYELLTGKTPFEDDGSISVLFKHLNEPVPSLSKYSKIDNPYLDAVIYKALAKEQDDRYQSAQALINDLKMAFAGQMPNIGDIRTTQTKAFPAISPEKMTVPFSELPPENSSYPVRHSPWMILIAGLAVIIVMVLAGLLVQQQMDRDEIVAENSSVESMTGDSMTGNLYFSSAFDVDETYLENWPIGSMEQLTREISGDGFYRLNSQIPDRAVATIFQSEAVYDDFAIQMTAALVGQSTAASGYGIIFNYVDNENYNVFAVDGLGRYSIWVRQSGNWRELRGETEQWTPHPAIQPVGEMNSLALSVIGDQMTGIVNGETVTTVTDATIAEGGIGIYLATPPNGNADVEVDLYSVMASLPALADSMTGN